MLHTTRSKKNVITKSVISVAIIMAVFFANLLFVPTAKINAQTTGGTVVDPMKKLSPALQKVVNGTLTTSTPWFEANSAVPYVQVLIQTYSADTLPVRQAVIAAGGTVWTRFVSINGIQAWVPKNQILSIAGRADVERMSPDHVATMSYSKLETWTGASSVRSYNASTKKFVGLDGTGIGIAVLDSGVSPTNKSFLTQQQKQGFWLSPI